MLESVPNWPTAAVDGGIIVSITIMVCVMIYVIGRWGG